MKALTDTSLNGDVLLSHVHCALAESREAAPEVLEGRKAEAQTFPILQTPRGRGCQ